MAELEQAWTTPDPPLLLRPSGLQRRFVNPRARLAALERCRQHWIRLAAGNGERCSPHSLDLACRRRIVA